MMMLEEDRAAYLALLEWQLAMGVDEAIGDRSVDRTRPSAGWGRESTSAGSAPLNTDRVPDEIPATVRDIGGSMGRPPNPDGPASNVIPNASRPAFAEDADAVIAVAEAMAAKCGDLDALRSAISVFEFCALKKGARNLVFADGDPRARVMVVGEAPGRDEDIQGFPFVGRAGRLLDNMFVAIGFARGSKDPENALYITNVLPWRPPRNRDPNAGEIAMMLPFLRRHVELADPELLVVMGNVACRAILGRQGITRLRGRWTQAFDRPVMPMFHPAALLRDGHKKRDAWSDLLRIRDRLVR